MSCSSAQHGRDNNCKKLKGVRRRKWGKWVSEIRVPRTQKRLWLGTYATPEAAAVAHDIAVYCLRTPSSLHKLNFPDTLSSYSLPLTHLSPRSVQKVASDIAMDVDAKNILAAQTSSVLPQTYQSNDNNFDYMFSLDGDPGITTCQGSRADCTQIDPFTISIEDYL